MARRTISLTDDLDRRIRAVAAAKGKSYSAVVAELLEARLDDPLPYEGAGSGPRDLSENIDRYLDKQFSERKR
jgi:hypothetical protein